MAELAVEFQARDVPKILRILNGFEPGSIPTYAAGALHYVCYYGSLDDIKTLFERYKYPTDTRHSSRSWMFQGTLLHVVCYRDRDTEKEVCSILEYLINEVGLSTDVISEYGDGLPLHVACARHSLDRVKMVSVGCDVNRRDEAGNTPLHIVCQNGSTNMVRYLVEERKCDFNVANNKGELPLHLACKCKYGKEIVRLVSVGYDVNRQDEAGNTPLHIACQYCTIDSVAYLVKKRMCDVNVANNKGELPLHLACQHNDREVVQLASVGCDVNRQDEAGNTPLHLVCQKGSTDIIQYLVEARECDFNVANDKGELPLHLACKCRNKTIVQLVSVGCDVDRKDKAGNTPLHIACRNSDTGMVKFLVEERKCVVDHVALNICGIEADTSHSSLYASLWTSKHTIKSKQCCLALLNAESNTRTLFEEAFRNNDYDACLGLMMVGECDVYTQIDGIDKCDVVYTLLCKFTSEHGIACTRPTSLMEGDTILHVASYDCQSALIKHLIHELKFSPSIANSKQEYPLHIACRSGCSLEVIKLLARCDVNRQDEAGNTPLCIACQNGSIDMVRYLVKERKCDFNVANNKGELPLHLACKLEIVQLVSVGCDVNRQDEAGNTPLHIACQNGSIDIVRCLVEESGMHKYGEDIVRLVSLACDVNTTGSTHIIEGDTMLHVALYNRQSNIDLIQHLISVLKFSLSVENSRQEYPLHIACRLGCLLEVMKLLGDCDVDHQDIDGNTPLHLACQRHDVITARFLMKERHCSNAIVNNKGELPLHHACRHQYGAFIIQDVSAGCDVNSQDNSGNTPLHLACDNCITESVRHVRHLVNERRCDINVVNNEGELPLHFACKHQNGAGIVRLVSVGCDINIQDKAGNTPLHIACLNCATDSIKYLAEKKCSSDVINNKGELPLHLACSHCFSVEAIELVSIGCDVNRQDNVGNTPLHLACRSSSADVVKLLIKDRNCTVNDVVNDKGELPLHLACSRCFSVEAIELVSIGCDVNRQDNVGNTPLHLACRSSSADVVKLLIKDRNCTVNDVVSDKGELPLHLACNSDFSIDEIKLVSVDCDVNRQDNAGNTPLHLACSSRKSIEIIKFLCEDLSCNPNLPNLKGERPLHLACRRGSGRIVEYFLSTLKVDVDVMDNANRTPLMCTSLDNPEIVKLLIKYGADPQHLYDTYQEFFKAYSSEKPPPTPLSIVVIGKHGTGKSTLIKALESEGCQDMVHAKAFTAGIIPSAYESESFGSVIWYDLAGQSEYYASHEAILHTILSASPPLILLLVDIRKDLKYIKQDILYWLNFLHCQTPLESVGTRPHLVVVFSFADLSPLEDSEDKVQNVRQNLASYCCKFQLEPVSFIALDCRMPNSDKIASLRSQLSASFKELRGIAKMNFILHCFYAFLLGNFKSTLAITASEVLALSEDWIKSGFNPLSLTDETISLPLSLTEAGEEASSDSEDSDDAYINFDFGSDSEDSDNVNDSEFSSDTDDPESKFEDESPARLLPSGQSDILTLCEELSNKGHIIFIRHKSGIERSWLIIDKEMILSEVNGSLFAPQQFRQHFKELSTNTGVVTHSSLVKHFPHHDPDMLIGFLTQLEFCQEIDDEMILQLLTDSDLRSHDSFFFFPGLVRIEKQEDIWKDDGVYSNACGWIMETTQGKEFFTPRFLQVLQLRIAFNFPLSLEPKRRIGDPHEPLTIHRCCSVWKNGISWKTGSGLECLVEVTEQCQAVVLMLRSISSSQDLTLHYISYRSSLIKVITSAVSDICPSLKVSESFCHSDHIQYPPQECEHTALYSLPSIACTICKVVQFVPCRDPEHDSIELEKLVTFEPFSHFNIHQLFNSSEKDSVITDDYLRRVSKSICSNKAGRTVYMMFTQEQNIPADLKLSADAIFEVLVDWRDSKHPTYSDLHCHLSQYSIFCDRDPQVRMEC